MPNTITGYDDYLIDHLNDSLTRATSIRIIVAFLMESGVRLIIGALAEAARRGIPIKILTGTYMSITEPSAVYHILKQLGQAVEIRFFTDSVRSFHPKAYIIDAGDDGEVTADVCFATVQTLSSKIDIRNGQYVVEQLERELSRAGRAGLVLEKYRDLAGERRA